MDDFGVKYAGEDNALHLINSLKEEFTISEDRKGGLYYGINLKWDYDKRTLDISMPGYIWKQLQKYKYQHPSKPQYAPYPTAPRKYGVASQEQSPQDTVPTATKEEITSLLSLSHKVIGGVSAGKEEGDGIGPDWSRGADQRRLAG